MRAIETKFGTIYIEDLVYDRHCPGMREEEDRIKIFDSNQNYMDEWSMDILYERAEDENKTLIEVYQDLIKFYEEADDIDALDIPDVCFMTDDVAKFALFMKVDGYLDNDNLTDIIIYNGMNTLDWIVTQNEWVNKIGNTYLLIQK